ncbi:MAG: hypothetical protein JRI23_36790 [Deltaproteobacteria bacterium]|jgi:hypothetical protein|nr:hypothetical protein [Deltaproteobacteria bacterium]MBW2537935.1 hypothetical protein [Deltaproteobacteria bacterium]
MTAPHCRVLVAATLICAGNLAANDAYADEGPDFVWGGLGYAMAGAMVGEPGSLGDELVATLGPGANPGEFFPMLGGGGWMLIGDRFMLGGKGFGIWLPSVEGELGSATISGGGGGFEIGYALLSEPEWLAFPFLGAGGVGLGLTIDNATTDTTLQFATNDEIPGGGSRTYEGGFFYLEAGVGFQHLMMWGEDGEGQGGWALGGEAGLMVSSFNSRWGDDSETALNGVDSVRLDGAFFRLTVGGGGFYTSYDE